MAILDPQTPSAAQDLVAIFDAQSGRQLFEGGRPMSLAVGESSKLMAHPREDGSSQIDHKIDLPVTISIPMIMRAEDYRRTYNELRQARIAGTRLTVQTKTFTHTDMFLESIPREEDPSRFDTISVIVNLVQAQIAQTRIQTLPPAAVANPPDSSTVDRGQVSGQERGGSILAQVFN